MSNDSSSINMMRWNVQQIIESAGNYTKENPFTKALNSRKWTLEELRVIYEFLFECREADL